MKKYWTYLLMLLVTVTISCKPKPSSDKQLSLNNHMELTTPMVRISTNYGDIVVRLYDETPEHRDNFLKLAREGYYDSTLFHRVIKDFMIQGGDPDSKYAEAGVRLGEGGPDYRLDAEFRTPQLLHKRGALAAAREGDAVNPMKKSSASQFYVVWGKIYTPEEVEFMSQRMKEVGLGELSPEQKELYTTVGGTPFLDGQYTVFGEITKGLEVVDKIQNVATDANDRPLEDVRILSVKVVE